MRGILIGFVLSFILLSVSVSAQDYYVNATTGDDTNDGLDPATPWKTISKINSMSFNPGDNIYFERGQTWREKLMVPSSGSSGNPITFGAYGSGNKPKLLGSNTKNNTEDWTEESSNIWYAGFASYPTYQNLIFDSESSQATMVANKTDLDTQGEAWWDDGNDRIYLYSVANPATYYNGDIEACRSQAIIQARDKSYLVFQDLDLRYSAWNGLYCNKNTGSPTNITIDGCTIRHTGNTFSQWSGSGIQISEVDNVVIKNNVISYTCDGVYLVYNTDGKTVTIDNNTISYNINGDHPACIAFGSNTVSDPKEFSNSKVSNNTIFNFRGKGITLAHASYMVVEYNIIHDGMVATGGEYAYCIGIHSGAQEQHHNIIRYNKIYTLAGAPGLWSGSVGIGTRNSHHDKIYYNVIYDVLKGIVVSTLQSYGQGRHSEIYNNVVYCDQYCIRVHNGIDAENIQYVTVQNNILNGTTDDFYVNDYVEITGGYNCLMNDASVGVGTGSTYTNTSDLYETDPLFTNAPEGNFHLQPTSPCIDAGTDVGLTQDFEGNPVPQGNAPDIGAYESEPPICEPNTYYVDATGGDDGNDGRCTNTAWKTISKVNSMSFNPGDNIYFERGQTWRERLNIPSSGNSSDSITFGAYGSGAKPIINGADLMTNWVIHDTNIWKKTGIDTEPYVIGFDGTYGEYESDLNDLDTNYEWTWASNVLYVYTDGGDPDTQWPSGIDVAQRLFGIYAITKDYINISNLDFRYLRYYAIDFVTVTYSNVEHCNIFATGGNGITVMTNSDNNTFSHITYSFGSRGFAVVDSDSNIFEYLDISESRATGKQPGGGGIALMGDSNSNIIRYSYIHDARLVGPSRQGDGIYLTPIGADCNNNEIYYNIITKHNDGMDICGDGNKIYNNIFYKNQWPQYWIGNGASNNIIKNNILYDGITNNLLIHGSQPATSNILDYNCYYDPDNPSPSSGNVISWNIDGEEEWASMFWNLWVAHGKYDQNSIYADPKFVDPENGDFRLQSGSPCIDAGTNVGLTQDFEGNPVPQGSAPDIGAYEYVSGEVIPGDLNNDGYVDILDLGIVAGDFGKTSGYNPEADVIQNGEIDIFDVVFVASRFT